jgi:hypothetical protein
MGGGQEPPEEERKVMNGSIKFKAIEVATGQELQFSAYFDIDNTGVIYRTAFEQDREIVAVQYTGLHDKNGVEIYDKDLVRFFGQVWIVTWYGLNAQFTLFTVTNGYEEEGRGGRLFSAGSPIRNFNWLDGGKAGRWRGHDWQGDTGIEVIGNIYSNPELLK